ncbi:unnamed protein product [Agarophyton chilense]
MSNYRRDPYAPQGDPYARSSSRQDPYASYASHPQKRDREYDQDRDSKRPRYPDQQQARTQYDPYSRPQEATYTDPYRSRGRDDYTRQDYRTQQPYGHDSRRQTDDRYQDPYARREDSYTRRGGSSGYDDRRNASQYDSRSGYDYSRADYGRRQDNRFVNRGHDERYPSTTGYDRQGYGDRQYDRRQSGAYGYGSSNRDNGGSYGRGGYGGGYDNGGSGYGGGRGRGGRGRGRGGRGRRGRGGGRGGGRGAEREKPKQYIPNFVEDLEMAMAERNFTRPDHDKRLDGPDFEIPQNPDSVFAEPTEDGPADPLVAVLEKDPDEESCSIMVSGFPKDGPMDKLIDYFKSMASLRKDPEHVDDSTIKLAFNQKKDVPFVIKWFKDPENAHVYTSTVKVHAVNPEVMQAS